MKTLSIILSSLSAIAVILAILYEGRLKVTKNNSSSKLTKSGWLLVIISVLVSLGNGISSSIGISDSENKYEEEKIRYDDLRNLSNLTIKELQEQGKNDSIRISQLEQITKEIGNKSDSIRVAVVDNAVKALEEQRKIIERQNQSIFINFKTEVSKNLTTSCFDYRPDALEAFKDTTKGKIFVTIFYEYVYLNKYREVSSNQILINNLLETAEAMKQTNDRIRAVFSLDTEARDAEIDRVVRNSALAFEYLYSLYYMLEEVNTFTEFEKYSSILIPPVLNEKDLYFKLKKNSSFQENVQKVMYREALRSYN